MIFKGRKSNKEYTSQDQLDVLKKLVRTIVNVKEDVTVMNDSITDAKNEYCEEFCPRDEDKKVYAKEMKKLIDLEVKALMKEDRTEANAIDRLIALKEEARAERESN